MSEEIFYKSVGEGEKVILLHGFCESSEIWDDCEKELSKDFNLFIPDIPGFGKSPLPSGTITIESVADDLYRWIEDKIGDDKVFIIGHSLGGYITLALAERYPDKIKGIGFINSTAQDDNGSKKESRLKTIEFIKKHGKSTFLDSFVPSLFNPEEDNSDLIEKTRKIADQATEEAMVEYTMAMRNRKSCIDILKTNDIPILFIAGMHDQVVTMDKSLEQMNEFERGVKVLLNESGHMAMIEQPTETSEAISKFIKGFS